MTDTSNQTVRSCEYCGSLDIDAAVAPSMVRCCSCAINRHDSCAVGAAPATQVGLLIGKPSVGSRDIVLAVVPHPDGEEVCITAAAGTEHHLNPRLNPSSPASPSSVCISPASV
jgi:hypothetical protein